MEKSCQGIAFNVGKNEARDRVDTHLEKEESHDGGERRQVIERPHSCPKDRLFESGKSLHTRTVAVPSWKSCY
jgi:hypothetical protein